MQALLRVTARIDLRGAVMDMSFACHMGRPHRSAACCGNPAVPRRGLQAGSKQLRRALQPQPPAEHAKNGSTRL